MHSPSFTARGRIMKVSRLMDSVGDVSGAQMLVSVLEITLFLQSIGTVAGQGCSQGVRMSIEAFISAVIW